MEGEGLVVGAGVLGGGVPLSQVALGWVFKGVDGKEGFEGV